LIYLDKLVVNLEMAKWFVNGGHLKMSDVVIIKEPEFKHADKESGIREEYKNAYNIYTDTVQPSDNNNSNAFLGVAFYNTTYKKLVADKIFSR